MKILAVKLRAIGDTVIWTSALTALHKAYPSAQIHVLTYSSNAAVLGNLAGVHATHFLKTKSRWELIKHLWALRKYKFDWLLGFHASTSLCRWAWLVNAKRMALHHHSWTHTPRGSVPIAEPGKLEDAISRDYQLLRAMGLNPAKEPTTIELRGDEKQWAENHLKHEIQAAGGDPEKPIFLFLPGASQHLRRYPKDLWLGQVKSLNSGGKYQPVVIVDQELGREWGLEEECLKMRIPLVMGGTLRAFVALISKGERALANDSGPGHIAVALGVTTSFIFGPGCAGDWHCYDRQKHPIYRVADVDCRLEGPPDREEFRFCTVKTCNHHKCMREIRLNM